MRPFLLTMILPVLALIAMSAAPPANAQWAAQPGATVRDAFGPQVGNSANQCRGACGSGCPRSCTETVAYECVDAARLRRIAVYQCGTHKACRVHDDCLDQCMQSGAQGGDCQAQCDAEVVAGYGLASSASWLGGGGPYDGKVSFEYTRAAPDALQPAYRCPDGSARQCSGNIGCATANGTRVEPVFDAYPAAKPGTMSVSAFRAGPLCGNAVCAQPGTIRVTGADSCANGRCTRFGMEFDYQNADPSAPLECTTSTSGGKSDFIGDLAKQGADAMVSRGGDSTASSDDGMAQMMGLFSKVLASADSPEDVEISMAPLGKDGKPVESQRVGSTPREGPPPIPRSIKLPSKSGHLFVPMYQMADDSMSAGVKQRWLRCTHKGVPVLETVFQLQPG